MISCPGPQWDRFDQSTAAFSRLYRRITAELEKYGGGLEPEEFAWIRSLIRGFQREFAGWETSPRPRRVLERLDRSRARALRVVGHAYIHIAYDLPRVVATDLRTKQISGARARKVYFAARNPLLEAFQDCCGEPQIFGLYGYIFHILRRVPLVNQFPFAIWASELRINSWSVAEQLMVSNNVSEDEGHLWEIVERNLVLAAESSNPFVWLKRLEPPWLPGIKGRPDVLDVEEFVFAADYVPNYDEEGDFDDDESGWIPKEGPKQL